MTTIAALFVDPRGTYAELDDVDLWGEARDARLYPGPHPVVAHPPCARWCQLAGLVEARYGHKRGEDGGCFAAALAAVRAHGGVLEHPAHSKAWPAFGLPVPSRYGGWQRGLCGGWSTQVEQGRYGHSAKKATWLYAFGVDHLPDLRWGHRRDSDGGPLVSWCANRLRKGDEGRRRLRKKEASATPVEFRNVLVTMARSVVRSRR